MAHRGGVQAMHAPDVELVVLTGGPCGGKSSLLDALRARGELGGRMLRFVPEAATILINQGLAVSDVIEFQRAVLRLQLQLEDEAVQHACTSDAPCAVICDRGAIDGAAYCTEAEFADVMAPYHETRDSLMARYGMVVHLVSAAVDAPEAYTTGNNEARFEDLDGAIAQENKTLAAWSDHPNRWVLGGFPTFDAKVAAAIGAIEDELKRR